MLGILIKQNLKGLIGPMMINPKDGKRRNNSYIAVIILVYGMVFGNVAITMGSMGKSICPTFIAMGSDWAYFLMMGLLGLSFAMIMTSLVTYAVLYLAKDNTILLSLPIKPSEIILSRLVACEISNLVFVSMSLLPSYIVYLSFAEFDSKTLIGIVVMIVLLSFVALSISGLMGYVVALVSSRLKKKNLATVMIALVFVVIYTILNTKIQTSIEQILIYAKDSGNTSFGYLIGMAFMGNGRSLIVVLGIAVVLSTVSYLVVEKTFLKIVSFKKGFKKNKLRAGMIKASKGKSFLIKREFDHLFRSANYLLNTSFGSVFAIIGAFVIVFLSGKYESLEPIIGSYNQYFALVVIAASLIVCAMNDIGSVIVSVESKTFWIIKSLPVDAFDVLISKLGVHFIVTAIPSVLVSIACSVFLRVDFFLAFIGVIVSLLYSLFSGMVGIALDLKHPRVSWESEILICKQSMVVLADMSINFFGTIAIMGLGFVISMLAGGFFPVLFVFAFYLVSDILLYKWIKKKGVVLYNNL